MYVNSTADSTHSDGDESHQADFWKTMTTKTVGKPSLELLDRWIVEDLAKLEEEFVTFISERSLKSNLVKSRGSSDKD